MTAAPAAGEPTAAAVRGQGRPRAGDLAWEERPAERSPSPSIAPVLRAGSVEGPLDWLLEQARAGPADLARLSVLALVGQCAAAVKAELARGRGRGDAADVAGSPTASACAS